MIHLKEFWYLQMLIPSNSTALSLVSEDDSFWQLKIVKVSGKTIINESFILNYYSAHIIFDRGRGRKLIKGYLLIDREYRFSFDREITSCSLILNVGSISMAHYEAELVHELINKHGFTSDSLFCNSVLLVLVKNVDNNWLLVERWSLTGSETAVLFRLQSGFPNDIVILHGEWLKVQVGEHRQGNVLLIPLQEFMYLLMLLISIPTVVTDHLRLSDIGFCNSMLATSDVYESHPVREIIIMANFHSTSTNLCSIRNFRWKSWNYKSTLSVNYGV
ncbi:uncharacterized protein LOC113302366 [Papaver somniferum]|uniref:uncharacterized protein LOC113302366 n=1 Tax=Papaver somniferum TaxID=3469 RepID=UPI000E6FD562|nr:uncharacterized protein LOC113302366 [Papaver somniferum]